MSACSQCGTVAKDTDKFCNVCGTPLARAQSGASAAAPGGAPPQYAPAPPQYTPAPAPGAFAPTQAPPPQPGQPYGTPSAARCQMGHEIAPGASYCAQGHPIALDQMQFANDAYGAPPAYAPAAGAPPSPYGAPQPGGPAAPPYGAAPAQAPVSPYGAPPRSPSGGYAQPPQVGGYGAPAPPPSPYAPQGQPQPYAPSPYGGGAPGPPVGQGFGAQAGFPPPAQPGYGAQPAPPPYQPEPPREAAPAKILRGFLVAYGSNPSGDFWPLTGGRLVVGRLGAAEGIDVSMQDPTISSRHAAMVIDATSGSVTVEDTGSTNGTFVNDEHIGFNGRRELRDGDRLRFGGYTTIVKVVGRV
jgi:hypothetical protein